MAPGEDRLELTGGWTLPDGYDDPERMADENLKFEISALEAHWREGTLTDEQEHYYQALRIELLNRLCVGPEQTN
jgi:hypothetical protein